MVKDFYKILGVEKGATPDQIKTAFRELAHKHHPDKQGGDAVKFKEINEAYQVLGNAEKRAKYDQFGSVAFDGGSGPGGFGGFDPSGFQSADLGDFGDLFGSMFGFGGQRRGANARGIDIETDVDLTFEEAAFGAEKSLRLYKSNRCSICAGGGIEPGSKMKSCQACDGKGQVNIVQRTVFGAMQTMRTCVDCAGRGQVPEKSCSRCKGSGAVKEEKEVRIKVPAGVDNGGIMKIREEGEAGLHGAPPGDLYLRLHVRPHKQFEREGDVVLSEKIIGFTQAALGDSVEVPTLHGPVMLKIPAGTQSATQFRLRGKGIRGADHLVTALVSTPERLTRDQKKLLEELDLRE